MIGILRKLVLMVNVTMGCTTAAQTVIHFKSDHKAMPNSSVSLYDLIQDESKPLVEALKEKLSSRIITRLQTDGEKIELSISSLSQHLKTCLSESEKASYQFSLPRLLKILSETPELSAIYVEKMILAKWTPRCLDCQIQISQVQLPVGTFKNWELVIPQDIPKGAFNIPMRVKLESGQETQYWIQGKVDVLKQVPVAQRALYIGERIQADDVKYEWRSTTYATDGAPSKNLLFGLRIKSPVAANQIVWSRNLEREKALKRGDVVRVFSLGSTWELSMNAVAQKDADLGDTVELKPMKAGKALSGVVTGQGEVQIK